MKTLALFSVLALFAVAPQDGGMPEPARPEPAHEWLQQLVGDWTVTSEGTMEPDAEPMRMECSESVRAFGGLWILAESQGAAFGDQPFSYLLTLGYDPEQGAFVGTWIDSMNTHMWSYRGTLDDTGRRLTLETEGPRFDEPGTRARYRDVIEVQDADHRTLSSSLLNEDGTWTTFMRAEYQRAP